MEVTKKYSKNTFIITNVFGIFLFICLGLGFYYGIDWFLINFSNNIGEDVLNKNISWLIEQVALSSQYFFNIVLPIIAGSILILSWIFWMILKISTRSLIDQVSENSKDGVVGNKKKDFIDQKIDQERKRRLFLHSLSVLQRDGRLLDFLDEDLNEYDDEQIGMAVRSIHDDCKKSIKKYIDLEPIIDKDEGDEVLVDAGFDMDSIKLVGNVSGEPPFKGVLKHPGWKAGKKEVPKLSDIQDSSIISPAEIKIQ